MIDQAAFNDLVAQDRIAKQPQTGNWTRFVVYEYSHTPLSGLGAQLYGQRFNPPGSFSALYLADDGTTGLHEIRSLHNSGLAMQAVAPYTFLTVKVNLNRVLDLTNLSTIGLLGTSRSELTGNWEAEDPGEAPTQLLGQMAFDSGQFSSLRFFSKPRGGSVNLVVFPDRLEGVEYVQVQDPKRIFDRGLIPPSQDQSNLTDVERWVTSVLRANKTIGSQQSVTLSVR